MITDSIIQEALPKLRKYSKTLFNNPAKADDLIGDTLLRAVNKQHLLKPDNSPYLWLKGIMYSVFCNTLKSDKLRTTDILEDYMYMGKPTQEDRVYCEELINIINNRSCSEAAKELNCCKATAWHRRNFIREELCISQ
jgi:DNA-directed RNA polymerase specialized sigma24 family protein